MNSVQNPHPARVEDFSALFDRVSPRLLRLALTYRIPRSESEDLVQQTFLTFLAKGHDVTSADGWLVTVMKRQCLRHLRTQRRRLYDALDTTILESFDTPNEEDLEKRHLVRELRDAIAAVPDRCRILLNARYRLGFDASETAHLLGYRESGFRKVASRCLAALSSKLLAPPSIGRESTAIAGSAKHRRGVER